MTGVLEAGALMAAVGAVVHGSKKEQQLEEEKTAKRLYRRFFGADLFDVAPARTSSLVGGAGLPPGLSPYAAASIRVMEKYQDERKQWFMGFSSSAELVGDARTRVLEELKQWLLTLDEGAPATVASVAARLDYCWQFLLRPGVFETRNERSFLQAMAEVCRQLEGLLRQTAATQRHSVERLGRVLRLSRELALAAVGVALRALSQQPREGCAEGVPPELPVERLAEAAGGAGGCDAEPGAAPEEGARSFDFGTEAGAVLRAMLSTPHFRMLCESDEGNSQEGLVAASDASPGVPLARVVDGIRATWGSAAVGAESGLLHAFCGPRHGEARESLLGLCTQVDRLAFFVATLHPYYSLAHSAGDVSMLWLRQYLSHLLQELEKALVQLRQSRLDVMRAAKQHLQELAQVGMDVALAEDLRWLKGLRHVDEVKLDRLHRDILAEITELHAATASSRQAEVHSEAQKGLRDIAAAFGSVDFQARCTMALPEHLLQDARRLGLPKAEGRAAVRDGRT